MVEDAVFRAWHEPDADVAPNPLLHSIFDRHYDVEVLLHIETYSLTVAPFALIGVAPSIFLGFRNNPAYDRYWEGRKLWGNLVSVTRSFARQTTNFVVASNEDADGDDDLTKFHREMVYLTIAYVHALRHHLPDSSPHDDLEQFLPSDDSRNLDRQKEVPLFILRRIGERIRWAWKQGWSDRFHLNILEDSLTRMTDIQGACERIKNTPIPHAYTILIHRIVAFYCLTLPFGIFSTVGVLTPVAVFLISQAFLGLEEIGDEIEDPFGTALEQLPLTTLCRTIEVNPGSISMSFRCPICYNRSTMCWCDDRKKAGDLQSIAGASSRFFSPALAYG